MGNIDCCPGKKKVAKAQHIDFSFAARKIVPLSNPKRFKSYDDAIPHLRNTKKKKFKSIKKSKKFQFNSSNTKEYKTTPKPIEDSTPIKVQTSLPPLPNITNDDLVQLLSPFNNYSNFTFTTENKDSNEKHKKSTSIDKTIHRRSSTSPDIDIEALIFFRANPTMFSSKRTNILMEEENTLKYENNKSNEHSVFSDQTAITENIQWNDDQKNKESYEWIDNELEYDSEMKGSAEELEMLETLRSMKTAHLFCSQQQRSHFADMDKKLDVQTYNSLYGSEKSDKWLLNDALYGSNTSMEVYGQYSVTGKEAVIDSSDNSSCESEILNV